MQRQLLPHADTSLRLRALIHPALVGTAVLSLGLLALTRPASAQVQGCTLEPLGPAGGERLRCRDGLVVEAEAGASYRPIDRNRDGRLEGVALSGKAVFVDRPSASQGGFQIRTPHAIASVRGTAWAVDVSPQASSVFVVRGRVGVARTSGRASVVLGPGEGVDVDSGTGPLEVKRWAPARASALLARFGR